MINKRAIKRVLEGLPLTAELYWQIRQQGRPLSKSFSLKRIEKWLPEWQAQVTAARLQHPFSTPRKILIFATQRYWIEHATLLGMALSGLGHDVTLGYLPYANWRKPMNRFDIRRQNAYANKVLHAAAPQLKTVSLLDIKPANSEIPVPLQAAVQAVSMRDTQYTLQLEDIDPHDELYQLRLERNQDAARRGLAWLQAEAAGGQTPLLLTPNGSILEMGILYQTAQLLKIPVVTYEFGEQTGRIWLAQDDEVMQQRTDLLWQACRETPLTEAQWQQVRALYAARFNGGLWENFTRRWQGVASQGGEQVRQALGLDERPIVLLAANVIGDSLTLGRQIFSANMTEWLERTIRYFVQRPDLQFVIRIHPGERYTQGPSVADLVQRVLSTLPADFNSDHIHLVAALDTINTYDLVEIASLGLVYTTTVGMEMAMGGVPVIVAGETHYRAKGFTLDPNTWDEYFTALVA